MPPSWKSCAAAMLSTVTLSSERVMKCAFSATTFDQADVGPATPSAVRYVSGEPSPSMSKPYSKRSASMPSASGVVTSWLPTRSTRLSVGVVSPPAPQWLQSATY